MGNAAVTVNKGFQWNLRRMMAERDLYQTTDLVPMLAQRGVHLSREQVYRLVTQPPQRLSMATLVALCDILDCGVAELIELHDVEVPTQRKTAAGAARPTVRKTTIRRPPGL